MAADGGGHPLIDGCPPEWASAWGQDADGVFVEFRFGAVDQRMRWIRPGEFMMGSARTAGWRPNEQAQHRVTLTRGYWLADTPVTQALWRAVMGENPSEFRGDERRPVECVSWEDCQRLCARLGERMWGPTFRLPTEAEWEYACRAGSKGATYAISSLRHALVHRARRDRRDPLDDIAWHQDNSGGETHAVKEKLANQWGLHDMLGNVWEWCSDWNSDYSSTAQRDPAGPTAGERRVFRGGAWGRQAGQVRAAYRLAQVPGFRHSAIGLRLARDQDQ